MVGLPCGRRLEPNSAVDIPQAESTGPLSLGTLMLVPPTEVAYGESDGTDAAPSGVPTPLSPVSPEATLTAMPRAAARLKTASYMRAVDGSLPTSVWP